jgi:predicted RNA binding protein YcfA (HicA-like mRNA interferase family)
MTAMSNIHVLKPRDVTALLEHLGFREVRQKGSHKQFHHDDGRFTTVPFHPGQDISPVLLHRIAREIGLTFDQLLSGKNQE